MSDLTRILKGIRSGDRRMLARAITHVENGSDLGNQLLALPPSHENQQVIGITGPPGAGKSTLVDQLISKYRSKNLTVGVVAVDPSSPFTQGAILGDRIRMLNRTSDPGVFIRSMATRGHLGGLNSVIFTVLNLYREFGFDKIIVETVGAGQSEVDVMKYCQTTVVVSVPGLGDGIQVMKAGILEIADIFVVNKSDLPGAEQIRSQIKNLLHLIPETRVWEPPVLLVTALKGVGLDELADFIERHLLYLYNSQELDKKLIMQIQETIWTELESQIKLVIGSEIEKLSNSVMLGEIDLHSAVKLLKKGLRENV